MIAPPKVVDRGVVDFGGVYIEDKHEDETFEQSVARCVAGTSKITLQDPLADPCA